MPVTIVKTDRSDPMRDWDPRLRPEWRWERVLEMLDDPDGPQRTTRHDDDYIKHARSFLGRWRGGDKKTRYNLRYENGGMYWAYHLFEGIRVEPNAPFVAEAMLLANFPFAQIADEIHTHEPAIEWYEAVFFNVRPRLRKDKWVLNQVLLPAVDRFAESEDKDDQEHRFVTPPLIKPYMDMTLKFFSYYGGPVLCDFILSGFKKGVMCHAQDEIGEWFDEHWSNMARRRSAQAVGVFDVNKYNVIELFAIHSRIIEIARGVEGQEDRHSLIERHIHAMLTEIPWTVGEQAKEVYAGTEIGRYDEMAAELRDEELLLVSAGEKVPQLEEVAGLIMPLGPTDKEVKRDGNAHKA